MAFGELFGRPVAGSHFCLGVADVGPSVTSIDEVDTDEFIDRVFERVQDTPFLRGETGQQEAVCGGFSGDKSGVDPFGEGRYSPSSGRCSTRGRKLASNRRIRSSVFPR